MPLVDIHIIEGVFSAAETHDTIAEATDTPVVIDGESMRGVTRVRVHDVPDGQWGIGAEALMTGEVRALRSAGRATCRSERSRTEPPAGIAPPTNPGRRT